ncbi:hypothetical protein [Xanthomonas albilineans]|uniref:hypothetical protein n=1 Tax=Xanthomonas albilineans TaxID=29447 RepID=UPI0012D46A12|nr:hypothetical protein [Xanthomonas albilineans]
MTLALVSAPVVRMHPHQPAIAYILRHLEHGLVGACAGFTFTVIDTRIQTRQLHAIQALAQNEKPRKAGLTGRAAEDRFKNPRSRLNHRFSNPISPLQDMPYSGRRQTTPSPAPNSPPSSSWPTRSTQLIHSIHGTQYRRHAETLLRESAIFLTYQ